MKCLHSSEGVLPPHLPARVYPAAQGRGDSTATTPNLHPVAYPGVDGGTVNPGHQHPKLAAQPTLNRKEERTP